VAIVPFTVRERPDLDEAFDELSADVWPEYNRHGDVVRPNWARLWEEAPGWQLVLFDEDAGAPVAGIRSIPLRWDGTVDGLPASFDVLLLHGLELAAAGEAGDALAALAIEILPERQGTGLSRVAVEALLGHARAHGLPNVLAPVRPSWKERYPLVPIARYLGWTREDGLPLDPWLRVHVRVGGEILGPIPESLRITGTVEEWEEWTGMAFPETGKYVFPHGLAPLDVDREADVGAYWEPNVWVRHRVR
jgi:GNAT superfamily N-acetyltransferase